jgi:hypothetical protein
MLPDQSVSAHPIQSLERELHAMILHEILAALHVLGQRCQEFKSLAYGSYCVLVVLPTINSSAHSAYNGWDAVGLVYYGHVLATGAEQSKAREAALLDSGIIVVGPHDRYNDGDNACLSQLCFACLVPGKLRKHGDAIDGNFRIIYVVLQGLDGGRDTLQFDDDGSVLI